MQHIDRVKSALVRGVKAGLRTGWWMTKMMIPITLGVAILKWVGVISLLAEWLTPVFKYIGLSAEGVLVFITASLTNLYAAIALIATLNIDFRTATILSVMGLICHNMIVETIIQRKAGASGIFIVVLRVSAALVAAVVLNQILPIDYTGTLIINRLEASDGTLGSIMYEWAISMVRLLPMMFVLILSLNSLQQILREFRLIDYLIIPLKPFMSLFGLAKESSFLWIVMNTLGLAYGGAVLIAEYEDGEITPDNARLLNTHVALNHSLLEDTILFAAIGIGAFWLVVPRVILAIVAVWGERLYNKLRVKNYELRVASHSDKAHN